MTTPTKSQENLYCENCGHNLRPGDVYCENCGRDTQLPSGLAAAPIAKKKKSFLKKFFKNKANRKFVVLLVGIGILGSLFFITLEGQLKMVKQQAQDLQKENQESVQQLSDQLTTQKSVTENEEKQLQDAQHALEVVKTQAAAQAGSNSFPTVNAKAIVLIVCFDASGSAQSGSGTIINSSGYILTNKHVVSDTSGNPLDCGALMNSGGNSPTIDNTTFYNLTLSAPNAGFYKNYDAAVLKIASATNIQTNAPTSLPASFPYIRPSGGNLKQGESLYIFGYPAASNFVFNVTKGIVSSFSSDGLFINTDAVIDHGNSGGAAITSDGRFVGIPTQKYVGNTDYLGQILDVTNLNVP